MEISEIGTLISTYGFPIIACGALFWKLNEDQKHYREQNETMRKAIDELRTAIVQLTQMVTALTEK